MSETKRVNSIAINANYLPAQESFIKRLEEKYAPERKLELDKLGEPILWAKNIDDVLLLIKMLLIDEKAKIDFLSDLTAYDNVDGEDGEARFVLVYQLYSLSLHVRVRIKCLVGLDQHAKSITSIFAGANWLEREVFDLYGIHFDGHPNLRRIMMDERFTGHPLRKDYHIKQREPFTDNIKFHLGEHSLQVDNSIKDGGESL
jgi:NADH-quinone oxidoreductase subunit C